MRRLNIGKVIEKDLFTDKSIELPRGSIKKLIGKDLTWNDEPVEII